MGTMITLGILAAIVIWGIVMYNNLVNLRNRVRNAFSQIDVQLTRRYDLIPNLVEAVKGYMKHERGTLEAVISARNAAVRAWTTQGGRESVANASAIEAARRLPKATSAAALGRLFALAEAYPDLKANQNMLQLQEELASHGEQGRVRPPGFQRRGHGLQQRGARTSRTTSSPACSSSRQPSFSRSRVRGKRAVPNVAFT